jgi:hypothetical protein
MKGPGTAKRLAKVAKRPAKVAKRPAKGTDIPAISVGTSSVTQKYLFAFATQLEVRQYFRTQAIPSEGKNVQAIVQSWSDIQPKVQALTIAEAGLADTMSVESLPQDSVAELTAMVDNELVRKSFSLPFGVAMVEIDKLVAGQRTVSLDFVKKLKEGLPEKPELSDMAKLCLSSERELAPIQHLELGPNSHMFTSPSVDLRFLGAFLKDDLSGSDMSHAQMGGVPAAAIIAFVGYGAYPVNYSSSATELC